MGEAAHLREFSSKIPRQLIHNLCALPGLCLALEDQAADIPIQQDQLAVGCQHNAQSGAPDTGFDRREKIAPNRELCSDHCTIHGTRTAFYGPSRV